MLREHPHSPSLPRKRYKYINLLPSVARDATENRNREPKTEVEKNVTLRVIEVSINNPEFKPLQGFDEFLISIITKKFNLISFSGLQI